MVFNCFNCFVFLLQIKQFLLTINIKDTIKTVTHSKKKSFKFEGIVLRRKMKFEDYFHLFSMYKKIVDCRIEFVVQFGAKRMLMQSLNSTF